MTSRNLTILFSISNTIVRLRQFLYRNKLNKFLEETQVKKIEESIETLIIQKDTLKETLRKEELERTLKSSSKMIEQIQKTNFQQKMVSELPKKTLELEVIESFVNENEQFELSFIQKEATIADYKSQNKVKRIVKLKKEGNDKK